MLHIKVLISKLLAIDGFATDSSSMCEVATLGHEALDHSVEFGALVVKRFARLAHTFLTSAQSSEVLRGLWGGGVKVHYNASAFLAHADVHEDFGVYTGIRGGECSFG